MISERVAAMAIVTTQAGMADKFIEVVSALHQELIEGEYVEYYSWSRETLDPRTKEPIDSNRFFMYEIHPNLEVAMTQRENPKLTELSDLFVSCVENVEQILGSFITSPTIQQKSKQ